MESRKSTRSFYREDEIETFITVPPDGGWGWVIVAAGFICMMVVDGIIFTFGMFLETISKDFGVTVGAVTLVGSVMSGFSYVVGPIASALVNRFQFRVIAIFGSLLAAAGYVLGSFCTNYILFVASAGVMTGIGLGFIYLPTMIVLGLYFEKWRALATGIATCGSGIGTMIVPPLVQFILKYLDWRNAYRVLGGMILLAGLMTLTYRPIESVKVLDNKKAVKIIQQEDSIGSFNDRKKKCCSCTCACRDHHNNNYPTTDEYVPIETAEIIPESTFTSHVSLARRSYATDPYYRNRLSAVSRLDDSKCQECCMKCESCMSSDCIKDTSRPMYRDDIFYHQSLMLLPRYRETMGIFEKKGHKQPTTSKTSKHPVPVSGKQSKYSTATGYHMSVTHVITQRELDEEDYSPCCTCSIAILRPLVTMIDCHLMKSPAFQLFAWNGLFVIFGYMIPFLYIKDRSVAGGIDPNLAYWLLSTIGAANTVGRIISGVLPSVGNVSSIVYTYICIGLAGILTATSGLYMKVWFQFFYAASYGFLGSCNASLRAVVVVEVFGLENLTNAFGLQLMFQGVAAFAGPAVAGILYDATKDFNISFYLAGGCLTLSAIMLIFVKSVRKWEIRKGIV